ncbi:hypothetical protein C0992_004262 [Termitomyces sp. T32_za158]|nr:hypothetical protein C0992_004262 [Termitomyces sp. T32_za158]
MSNISLESGNAAIYDPRKVLQHPQFRVLAHDEKPSKDANIAAFYNPSHEIHLVEKPRPDPGPGQVLVHVRATGICGSDVHFWQHGRIGDSMVVSDECGSGHESAGEVVEVGEGVTEWKAIVSPLKLAFLAHSRRAMPAVQEDTTLALMSSSSQLLLSMWLHRLPDNVSYEEGALCEPLSVALAGIERSGLRLGDPVLICGAGPIGLVSLLSARAAGAEPIIITDLFQSRLDFAKTLIPSVRTVLIQRDSPPKEQAERIKVAAGVPLAVSLECTGVQSSIHTAVYSMKFGGKVFIIGVGKNEQVFPFMHLSANEIDVGFQYRYANQYPKAIRLVNGGLINLKPLVTHKFALEDAVKAFHVAADPSQGAIKVQIVD